MLHAYRFFTCTCEQKSDSCADHKSELECHYFVTILCFFLISQLNYAMVVEAMILVLLSADSPIGTVSTISPKLSQKENFFYLLEKKLINTVDANSIFISTMRDGSHITTHGNFLK